MRAGWFVALLAAAALGGCAGDEANPNLSAPKLVLQVREEGDVVAFIHSAFGERIYEWVSLRADNETIENRTQAFSLERSLNGTGFFLEASAGTQREMYALRARVDVDPAEQRALVAFLDVEDNWSEPADYSLPFERVLARRAAP